jgi:hypothetical protein
MFHGWEMIEFGLELVQAAFFHRFLPCTFAMEIFLTFAALIPSSNCILKFYLFTFYPFHQSINSKNFNNFFLFLIEFLCIEKCLKHGRILVSN